MKKLHSALPDALAKGQSAVLCSIQAAAQRRLTEDGFSPEAIARIHSPSARKRRRKSPSALPRS